MNVDNTPDWFRGALATPGVSAFVMGTRQTRLHYLGWGLQDTHKPGLLLVHGYRAHAHYWDFIAPFFTDRYRVAAIDLSGMGDSDRRDTYEGKDFADDIAAVILDARLGPATLIGHSFGGSRSMRAAAEYPELVRHVIALDSTFRFADTPARVPAVTNPRTEPYPDYQTARARYRLAPAQPCLNPFLFDYVADHSLGRVGEGWLWKFDPRLPPSALEPDSVEFLRKVRAPADYVRGALSAVSTPATAARVVSHLAHARRPVELPQAYHYLMLDQPLALVAALNALLA